MRPQLKLKTGKTRKPQLKPKKIKKKVSLKRKARERHIPQPYMTITDAMKDPNVFGPWFTNKSSWRAWTAFLKTIFCLKLTQREMTIVQKCTQRTSLPKSRPEEVWMVCGRRGGKSLMMALVATFFAMFFDWRPYLVPGERATIVIIAADRRQARVIFRYIEALVKQAPLFIKSKVIKRETSEIFDFKNQSTIEIHTASFRAIRGYTIPLAVLDELAFWRTEDSMNPDYEIIAALKPGMASIPGSMLMGASSPYSKRGALYDAWKRYYGENDQEVLVWQAPTWWMNPTISRTYLIKQYKKDKASAKAEYGAEFRKDVENLFSEEVLAACTDHGVYERPYVTDNHYFGFVDPSGGASDSFTLAISHIDNDGCPCLDVLRERRPPFSPEAVTEEYSKLLKSYQVFTVHGDRYGGEWPKERFEANGINYEVCKLTKSELYAESLSLLNSGQAGLLDQKKMRVQFESLERRTGRRGKDNIDHPPKGHDDVANSAAGALWIAKDEGEVDVW